MSDNNPIVLPIDFSDRATAAVPWARRMAAMTNAAVHCIYSVEPPQVYSALDITAAVVLPTVEEMSETAQAKIVEFISEHLGGIDTEAKIVVGKPADAIIKYANEVDASMIVIATHGYSGLDHVLLGSTTEAIVRKASCPVLSVRNQ